MTPNALSDALHALEIAAVKPSKPVDLRASALYYAARLGWPVFPLKPRGKTPLTEHGFMDASADAATIAAWWDRHPDANIGLPTGPRNGGGIGYDVIDADGPAGVQAWSDLKHRRCPPGCSREAFCPADGGFTIYAEAVTPGNAEVGRGPGRHVYVPASGRGNSARVGGRPLDLRGAGGYVVAVPSINFVGSAYVWITPPVAT